MYETQILAARALRDLLDKLDRNDRNELLALVRVLQNAIATGNPVTQKDHAGIAKYLRRTYLQCRSRTIRRSCCPY